jgi:ketosteroid isomerase-like protein
MSQENVEIIRGQYAASDPSRWFDALDEEIEIDFTGQPVPDSAVIRGKENVIHWFRRWWATWDDYTLEIAEIFDPDDDTVVVVHDERGRGKGSGVQLERRWAAVYTLRAGSLVRIETFNTREEALEAAGLSE